MRPNAAPSVFMALACLLVCPGSLVAKPTRTLAHAAGKPLVPQPASRSSREHATRKTTTAQSTALPAAQKAVSSRQEHLSHRAAEKQRASSSPKVESTAAVRNHRRSLQQERDVAAQSAIAAANRTARKPSNPAGKPAAPSQTASSSELASATSATKSTTLINIDGLLRPLPGNQPLPSIEDEAATPVLLPKLRVASLYDSRGNLVVPPPLYGTHEILLHQNEMADHDGLDRVRDDAELLNLRRQNQLVALPESDALRVDYRLPENRRFSRPWTAAFLAILARDYYTTFHAPLQVDSAVRTVTFQQRLIHTNGNAAPARGDTASPHLTGQAVDIAKGGLTRLQIAWMRTYLQPLIDLGKIDVEEEFQQSCFHISVYKNFLPPTASPATASRQTAPESLSGGPSF